MTGAAASERNKWQGTNNSKKKSKANSIASKSIDYSSSLSSDQEIDPVRKKVRHQSRLLLADGAFDVSQLTRDLWLDNRQSVQNGTRCIRCDVNNVRYMCTSRSLRELEEGQSREIVKRFKQVFQAQKDLALLTTFVQPVIAARAHRWDLLVINPLPSNMYLCDLKKLAVHLSHSTVRYYAACILLGLEFMRHQCIYHGNLSLASIALDHYGRPQITDFDTLLYVKDCDELSHRLDALRYAALLGVLHCDNIRHFSIAHMYATSSDSRRRDLFIGICPKCRITAECIEPKLCDCTNFGALVRFIRNKIVTKDAHKKIIEKLQSTWIEADLRYTWSRIPKVEEEKLFEMELARSASQQIYSSRRFSSRLVDTYMYDELDSNESDTDATGQARISRVSIGIASSLAAGTAITGGGASATSGAKAAVAAIEKAKKERQWHRRQELQLSRVGSSAYFGHSKAHLLGWSSDSFSKSVRDSTHFKSAPGTESQGANNENGTANSTSASESGSMLELDYPPLPTSRSLNSTHPVPKPRLTKRALPGQMQLRIDSNDEGPTTMKSGTFDRLIRYGAVIAGSVNTGGQAAEQKEGKARSGHNQGSVIPQTNCSNSSAAENNLTQEQKAIPVTSAALVGINKLINNDFQSDEQYEFVFNGYQQMMQHKYFTGTNWAALETAQPPEGFWFVHSLIMQHYSREQAAPNQGAAGNAGVGDDTDRLIGSYFTSRSRILYSLFG